MSYIIGNKCIGVKDGICIEVCPVECITETDEMMLINPAECIDCGMCLSCPVDAIYTDEDEAIAAEGIGIVNKNYNFFNLNYEQ
jgi:ferredoxin